MRTVSILRAIAVDDVRARGSIKDTDVHKLRRAFDDDGAITPDEAQTLIDLHDACPVQDASWSDCFVDLMTDYVVNQAAPEGYVTAEKADWLIGRISTGGRVESKTELELLVSVLDASRWTPERLVCFALQQVKSAVLDGEGPLRAGRSIAPGTVCDGDVELIRRILYAFGGDGMVAISRAEAEILFAIDDATAGAVNADAWRDLFVRAIANCMMAASGHAVPTREEALAGSSPATTDGTRGVYVFPSLDAFLAGQPAAMRQMSGGADVDLTVTRASAFVQDH